MNPYILFAAGLFLGTVFGIILIGVLTFSRLAELEHTAEGLRSYIRYLLEEYDAK